MTKWFLDVLIYLLQHVKTVHDKIKSFVCDKCDGKFTESGSLTRQMRTHTAEKPFHCMKNFCNVLFEIKSHSEWQYESSHENSYKR